MRNDINKIIEEIKRNKRKQISVTLEPKVLEEARKISKELKIPLSFLINLSLKILINTNANEIEKAKLNNKGK